MINRILTILLTLWSIQINAQTIHDLNSEFAAQVKSIDEFICRFNGTEDNQEIKNDSAWRKNNILSLFDFQMNHNGLSESDFKKLIVSFLNRTIESHTKLKITDANIWAEAKSSIKINGRKKDITLILKSETYKENRVRWAIAGVKGLVDAGIIDTTNYCVISPVEHEIHFMTLDEIFSNRNTAIMGYRSKDAVIDELSVFLTLAMTGNMEFDMVDKLTIHCLEVPGYAFTINEQVRRGNNSGWLITSLTTLNDNEKEQYIKKLLNR